MPPSLAPLRALVFRPVARQTLTAARPGNGLRRFADARTGAATNTPNKMPKAPEGETKGPNTQQQEHVSEEAAKVAEITGGTGPDIEQGTPVEDILKQDPEAMKNAPQVVKDDMKKKAAQAAPGGKRQFSTMARRMQSEVSSDAPAELDGAMLPTSEQIAAFSTAPVVTPLGHKYPLPELPLGPQGNKNTRYDPVVTQVTNALMRSGKKATAQRNMNVILNHLRTAPAPTYNPSRPLLPGAPPASHLPLHPILYLTLAIDSVAPLLRIRQLRGAAGGGASLPIPVPLSLRQRRRAAIGWIIETASKKPSRGSGNNTFATRVAEEIVSVVEGKSGAWEKRGGIHRAGTTARINVMHGMNKRR